MCASITHTRLELRSCSIAGFSRASLQAAIQSGASVSPYWRRSETGRSDSGHDEGSSAGWMRSS